MNKLMNLIGIKARKASHQNINTKIKNKVLKDYAKLIDKKKFLLLKKILRMLSLPRLEV